MSRSLVCRRVALVCTLWMASGCFRYIPTEVDALPPGENVRLYVNRSVVQELQEIRDFDEPILRGRVIRRENEDLFIRIPVAVRQEGFHSAELGQDVRVPIRDIIQLERRQIDRIGTGALVAGSLGMAAVVLFVIMEAFGDLEDDEDCPDCVELMTPLISIPFRR